MTVDETLKGYLDGLASWGVFLDKLEDDQSIHPSGLHYLREMTEHMDSLHNGLREQNVFRLLQTWPLAKLGLKMGRDDGAR